MIKIILNQFSILKFINFNLKNLSNYKPVSNSKILIEVNNNYPAHVIIHYLIRIFNKDKNYELIGYLLNLNNNFSFSIKHIIKKIFPMSIYKIYKSLGVKSIISFSQKKKENIEKIRAIIKNTNSLEDLLNLKVDNIYLGDLIYDSYLRQNKKVTINLNEKDFRVFYSNFLDFFFNCCAYFNNNKIDVLLVSHTVYQNAVPLRIALSKNIKCYLPNINVVDYFDKKRNTNWNYDAISQNFIELNDQEKSKAIQLAKQNLEKKFDPNNDYVAELYLTGRKFNKKDFKTFKLSSKKKKILKKNGKKNYLISSHCFFDSPHVMGNFFYLDFYRWLEALGKMSENLEINWYLKAHPHTLDNNLNFKILKKFENKYKNFYLLDKDVSNIDLISEGIDLVLSVYGSVAYEFPYHKIPVLLASNECIYKKQVFCATPKNLAEYEFLIKNPDKINIDYNRDNIYEFFYSVFMNFWDPLNISSEKFNIKSDFFSPQLYDQYLKKYYKKENEFVILNDLSNFLKSGKYRISSKVNND